MTPDELTGRLLVATPILGDPNFDRTVVLLLEHSGEGAVGLVLNRPSDTDVAEPLPEWNGVAAVPSVIFVGGPVSQSAVIGLARCGAGTGYDAGWRRVGGGIAIIDLAGDPPDAPLAVDSLRLFAGYAGWSPFQLESEIDAGAWWVVEAVADDALSPEPDRLWSTVLRRQRGRLAMHAFFPADPAAN